LEEASEGVRLSPDAGVAYGALAHSSICLDRYHDARAALHQALTRKVLPTFGRYMLFGIGFLEGDAAAMQGQVDAVAGTPAEAGMLANQSVVAAYAGQVRRARELTDRSVGLAVSRGLGEGASLYSAGQALWEAAYGDCRAAKRTADRTLVLSRGRPALSWSALALAMCGESSAAQRLVAAMERRFPQDFFLQTAWIPMARAALEIRRGHPDRAVALLETAEGSELGTVTALFACGRAHLDRGAARRRWRVPDHPGPQSAHLRISIASITSSVGAYRLRATRRVTGDVAERKSCDDSDAVSRLIPLSEGATRRQAARGPAPTTPEATPARRPVSGRPQRADPLGDVIARGRSFAEAEQWRASWMRIASAWRELRPIWRAKLEPHTRIARLPGLVTASSDVRQALGGVS
jgi:hypothetical protein